MGKGFIRGILVSLKGISINERGRCTNRLQIHKSKKIDNTNATGFNH